MSRFFVHKDSVKDNTITITGEEAHHIADVMRLKAGDEVTTFDGTGKEYSGVIKESGKKSVVIEVRSVRQAKRNDSPKIILIQAIPKKEKMDYLVEKATELGVDSITPVFTERTIPDWGEDKKASRVARWRKIALEASKQCGRPEIPEIRDIADFSEIIKKTDADGLKLIAALQDKTESIKKALVGFKGGRIYIAIGPEGDFTPGEVGEASKWGFKPVSLGPRVLKSDTAGLFAISVIGHEHTE